MPFAPDGGRPKPSSPSQWFKQWEMAMALLKPGLIFIASHIALVTLVFMFFSGA